jgi:c-di-GMP-binding flagellar brake protein YcgR
MNSLTLIQARLTVSGLAIIFLLILWFFIKRSSEATNGTQRRRFRRHSILVPVEVGGKEGVKGLTDNLSLGGCRMNGNLALRRGQHLALRLLLPGQESPIVVERAAVRWVVEKDFGLQFMSIPFRERERLEGLLQWVA